MKDYMGVSFGTPIGIPIRRKEHRMNQLQAQRPGTMPPLAAEIVTIGRMNFIVGERFAQNGKKVDELMERLVIEKCRKIS